MQHSTYNKPCGSEKDDLNENITLLSCRFVQNVPCKDGSYLSAVYFLNQLLLLFFKAMAVLFSNFVIITTAVLFRVVLK